MASTEQSAGDARAYLYESPYPKASIWLDYGVVDRIASEALRGLSALPRRGMEVGGLLLGRVGKAAGALAIRIEDCLPFECEHLYGPSFHLSPKDRDGFAAVLAQWAPSRTRPLRAVGLYRTHTRGELELTAEDIELMDAFFPGEYALCLMVRPFAMRPAEAAFFLRHEDGFRPGPPAAMFVFRRKEMGGGATPRGSAAVAPAPAPAAEAASPQVQEAPAAPLETVVEPAEASSSTRGLPVWFWIAALVVFLLAGVTIGVQISGGWMKPAAPPPVAEPFTLGLSALQFGDAIHFRWNPRAPALGACRSASLVIRDGDNTKIIDLRKEDIARGALIYRFASPDVHFRLEAVISPGNMVTESLHVRMAPAQDKAGEPAAGNPLQ